MPSHPRTRGPRVGLHLGSMTALALVLLGCSSPAPATVSSTATPEPEGAETIQEVWDTLGCSLGGATEGKLRDAEYVFEQTGMCDPWDDLDESVFFYQAGSPKDLDFFFERAASDFPPENLFVDGLVVIRADNATVVERLEPLFDHRE